MTLVHILGLPFAALAVAAIAYQLIALAAVMRFFAAPTAGADPGAQALSAVSVLKPLHGAEPRLAENLGSFLAQDYAGPVQLVCGTGDASDGALPAVSALRAGYPAADIALSTGPRRPATNAKIGNVLAMLQFARHDILVLSDSDMAVRPDYLSVLLAALDRTGTGAVTCLYVGRGDCGWWSRISAAMMSYCGLPNMVMALATGIAQPCLGSTIAIRRATLATIGGFERFADVLADDYAMGEAIAAAGLAVTVPPMLLTHCCAQGSVAEVWRQHLRWAVTIRGVAPLRHLGSGVVHAVPLAILTTAFMPLPGVILVSAALAARLAIVRKIDRVAARNSTAFSLVPIADCLEFAVYAASLVARTIHWRGNALHITGDGRIAGRSNSSLEVP